MRYFLEIAYKGTNYHGWQSQPNAVTVQETIEKAMSLLLRCPISILGAGRTDTGVHAEQMFAHFDIDFSIEKERFIYKMNSFLPSDIAIKDLREVQPEAHARFDAEQRSYRYQIYVGKNPFYTDKSWQLFSKNLNIDLMNTASGIMLEYNDFQCFSRSNSDVRTYICDIKKAEWKQEGQWLLFSITADRFLRNMVRAVVGTLVNVGEGKTSLEEFRQIIESKNRSNAGASAPAQGLFLTEVTYPKKLFL
ncbi:MAG: tRNA pseudouridine(38-40) synthase TruA [Flavobacteriaceae bacterium]|nr:tRNA pseudouridine(38-40) synthase TruA [Flavobacteriaceae bacterium]